MPAEISQSYKRTHLFVGIMCSLGAIFHIYFVNCFYTFEEFKSMTAPQLDALLVMNYGLVLFFAGSALLSFRFSSNPVSPEAKLTLRVITAVFAGRLVLEFIFPVNIPLSPVFPEHTSLVFKCLLAFTVLVVLIKEIYWKLRKN